MTLETNLYITSFGVHTNYGADTETAMQRLASGILQDPLQHQQWIKITPPLQQTEPEPPLYPLTNEQEEALTGLPAYPFNPPLFAKDRILTLATKALQNCLTHQQPDTPTKLPLILLCLPDDQEILTAYNLTTDLQKQRGPNQFFKSLTAECHLLYDQEQSEIFIGQQETLCAALTRATELLTQDPTLTIYLGGVDCLFTEERLRLQLCQNQLLSRANPYGFLPGEASAFLCLQSKLNLPAPSSGAVTPLQILKGASYPLNPPPPKKDLTLKRTVRTLISPAGFRHLLRVSREVLQNTPFTSTTQSYLLSNHTGAPPIAQELQLLKSNLAASLTATPLNPPPVPAPDAAAPASPATTTPVQPLEFLKELAFTQTLGEVGVASGPLMLAYAAWRTDKPTLLLLFGAEDYRSAWLLLPTTAAAPLPSPPLLTEPA